LIIGLNLIKDRAWPRPVEIIARDLTRPFKVTAFTTSGAARVTRADSDDAFNLTDEFPVPARRYTSLSTKETTICRCWKIILSEGETFRGEIRRDIDVSLLQTAKM